MSDEKLIGDKEYSIELNSLVIEMVQKGNPDSGKSARIPVVDCPPKTECTCKGLCGTPEPKSGCGCPVPKTGCGCPVLAGCGCNPNSYCQQCPASKSQ